MHFVFWIFYGLMLLYALVFPRPPTFEPDGLTSPFAWRRWVVRAFLALILIIFCAGFTNGEKTMQSANTRFPIWSWRDGPPPTEAEPAARSE